jgi:cephalosporin hydroxylase
MDDSARWMSVEEIREAYRGRYGMRLYDWLVFHQREIVFSQCSYFGVRTLKNPFDVWIYQEIITEVKPEVIVEIGSASGGSTLFLAHLLDALGGGSVVSVDIDRSSYQVRHERIIEVTGNSSAPETVARVFEVCDGRPALVIHDGDHRRQTVLHELRQYSPLVAPGSYFIVEDGIVDLFDASEMNFEGEGPLYAIQDFLAENRDFRIDFSRERYILTYNPHGFLQRVHPG